MHAEAERGSRGIVVYLLPGLTAAQRKAALRRLRQEGSRGCGPGLPLRQLAVALVADRLRAGAAHTTAAIRQHPAGTLLPALLAGGLLTMFMFASATVRIAPAAEPGTPGDTGWSVPVGTPGRGGPGGTPPNAASVGGQAAGTSATAPPPATTAHGKRPAKSTHAGGGQAATVHPSPGPNTGPVSGAGPAQPAPAPEPGIPPAS
jgi:hypothetical protein